jgi:multimeric flavodoxin WrbA
MGKRIKVVAFNGSTHGRESMTSLQIKYLFEGMSEAGAETEEVVLLEKNIRECLGCLSCQSKTLGRCVIKDDFTALLEKFNSADIVIMAVPLHIKNVTGIMKIFFDRFFSTASPYMSLDERGKTTPKKDPRKEKKVIVVSNCGFPDISQFDCLRHVFADTAEMLNWKIIGEIYKSEGPLYTQREIPRIIRDVLGDCHGKQLKEIGKSIMEGEMRKARWLIEKASKQLIGSRLYVAMINFFTKLRISSCRKK